jgi:hypothetical protein
LLTKYINAVDFLLLPFMQYNIDEYFHQETFVRVAMWCLGEYGDLLINNVEMLDIEDPITVSEWIVGILSVMFLMLLRFHENDKVT